jgi:integrase
MEAGMLVEVKQVGIPLKVAVNRVLDEYYSKTTSSRQAPYLGRWIIARDPDGILERVTRPYLKDFVSDCRAKGNATSTINSKLSFFARMFIHFEDELVGPDGQKGTFVRPPFPWATQTQEEKLASLRWWLKPDLAVRMCAWIRDNDNPIYADYIEFVANSGVRVEEALRLQRRHFDFEAGLMTVPGTKTTRAHRTIPLFSVAQDIATRRLLDKEDDDFLFAFSPSYPKTAPVKRIVNRNQKLLAQKWDLVSRLFGIKNIPTATPRALRRTFARFANDRGMPTETLRLYLGHERIETTQGYLKLVGGHDVNVMRKYVA